METRELVPLALALFVALLAGWLLALATGAGGRSRHREQRDRDRADTERILGRLRRQLEDAENR
ncbi:MAG TPA: hypothetical protein VFQ51_10215, partial [Vicinamibacteria bacterium]|nr:hypothetical protein [Vicinamibacteria bacterium]